MCRRSFWLVLIILAVQLCVPAAAENETRVRDLREQVGEKVTVKGRTGQIIESGEVDGERIFTLRDDFGDEVRVVTRSAYPIMGVTYRISGTAQRGARRVFFLEDRREQVYSQHWLLGLVGGIVGTGGGLLLLFNRLALARARRSLYPEAWGEVEVISGAGRGQRFPLRGEEVWLGRQGLTAHDIVLPGGDRQVSRRHGVLRHRNGNVHYEDNGSKFGSSMGTSAVAAHRATPITQATVLGLGPATHLRIRLYGAAAVSDLTECDDQYTHAGEPDLEASTHVRSPRRAHV